MALLAKQNKKRTVSDKKRIAAHHRKSKSYAKHYWPYIPMLLIILMGVGINSLLTHSAHVLGAQTSLSATSLLYDTNAARTSNNKPELALNTQLDTAAQNKANDMAKKDYWSHVSPTGETPWDFITAAGYDYQAAGENLAYGFSSSSAILTGWMASPEHRANILDTNYQDVGFGVATSLDYQQHGPEIIVVAEYGDPVTAASHITFSVPAPSSSSKNGASLDQSKLVSRLDEFPGGSNQWSIVVLTALCSIAATILVFRHGKRLRNGIAKTESAFVHHPFLDCMLLVLITTGALLTRSIGFIR